MITPANNFKPNLASSRAIRFSGERGENVNPTGEGVLLPKPPKMPKIDSSIPRVHPPKTGLITPRIRPAGRRYYGEGYQ